jgi:hypothetical protein
MPTFLLFRRPNWPNVPIHNFIGQEGLRIKIAQFNYWFRMHWMKVDSFHNNCYYKDGTKFAVHANKLILHIFFILVLYQEDMEI